MSLRPNPSVLCLVNSSTGSGVTLSPLLTIHFSTIIAGVAPKVFVSSGYQTERRQMHIRCANSGVMKSQTAASEKNRLRRHTDRWWTWRLCTAVRLTVVPLHWYPQVGRTKVLLFCTTSKPVPCGIHMMRDYWVSRGCISRDGYQNLLRKTPAGKIGR